MDNDTNIVNTDTSNGVADDTASHESDEQTEVLDLDTADNADIEKEKLLELNKKLYERAKRAEAEAKELKQKVKTDKPAKDDSKTIIQPKSLTEQDIQIQILKAQGMSDDLISELKKVAAVTGTDYLTAQKDELFLTIKEKLVRQKKSEDARLSAARGVAKSQPKKSFDSPDLSDEEHKKLWREAMGQD